MRDPVSISQIDYSNQEKESIMNTDKELLILTWTRGSSHSRIWFKTPEGSYI